MTVKIDVRLKIFIKKPENKAQKWVKRTEFSINWFSLFSIIKLSSKNFENISNIFALYKWEKFQEDTMVILVRVQISGYLNGLVNLLSLELFS